MALNNYNYDAPYGIKELGYVYLTELAREIQQNQADPLAGFLPQREIQEKQVRVEWTETDIRPTGVVKPGMPNKLNNFGVARSLSFEAATFRRGMFIDQDTINHLRAPGTQNKLYGMELVTEQLSKLVEQGNTMMTLLRAQLLSGGINYTDVETGVQVLADSGIPAKNFYQIGTIGGVAGTAGFATNKTWDDVDSTPVTDVKNLLLRMEIEGRNRPTKMIMHSHLLHALSFNKEILSYLPGNVVKPSVPFMQGGNMVTFAEDGMPATICGLEIVRVKMFYDDIDPADGKLKRRYLWPLNKVTFLCTDHPLLPGQVLGRTYLTRGEHPNGMNGGTGVWVRTFMGDTLGGPTTAPGVGMQVGMAGLPALHKPWWVHVVTVASVDDVKAKSYDKFVL